MDMMTEPGPEWPRDVVLNARNKTHGTLRFKGPWVLVAISESDFHATQALVMPIRETPQVTYCTSNITVQ
jgi:hypothetical protein